MELEKIALYRITHIENIPHVLQYGITHKSSPHSNPAFISIGDRSLIQERDNKQVRVNNGDIQKMSVPTITLGNFIPFYFGVRMPMLYVVQNGGNFVEKATPPQDIVYLKCLLSDVAQHVQNYFFSNGHATADKLIAFYDKTMLHTLPNVIDWDAVNAQYWGRQENLNIKVKKQAEFLVANDVPPACIAAFGCYNATAKQKLISFGVEASKIKLIPEAYY